MDLRLCTAVELNQHKVEIIDLLYERYEKEMKYFPYLEYMDKEKYSSYINHCITDKKAVVGIENNKIIGIIIYQTSSNSNGKHIDIPVYGYGAYFEDECKIISKLFQHLAKKEVNKGITDFSVHIYAHDKSVKELFSFMQFGTMAETCIRKTRSREEKITQYCIQSLSKYEIEENWKQIWSLTEKVINHLSESPIFYDGSGFTEDLYRAFYLDGNTTLYAAYDNSKNMIGIIESNNDENKLLCPNAKSVNVGEVYVLPEYRGTGLAQDLLHYAENYVLEQGVKYMWVEHGTANPNARGFWNRYFDTYQYELVREITL